MIEVVVPQFLIALTGFEDMVNADEDLVGNRDVGALFTLARLEASMFVFEIAAFLGGGAQGRFDQNRLKINVSFADRLAAALVRAVRPAVSNRPPRPIRPGFSG